MLALLASAVFLRQNHGSNEPTGPPANIAISIPRTLNPMMVKIAVAKGCFLEEGLHATFPLHAFEKLAMESLLAGKADVFALAGTLHKRTSSSAIGRESPC